MPLRTEVIEVIVGSEIVAVAVNNPLDTTRSRKRSTVTWPKCVSRTNLVRGARSSSDNMGFMKKLNEGPTVHGYNNLGLLKFLHDPEDSS